jgi:hypothetical protein
MANGHSSNPLKNIDPAVDEELPERSLDLVGWIQNGSSKMEGRHPFRFGSGRNTFNPAG